MNCHYCSQPIKNPRDKQKFCSGRCRAAWHRENAKGSAPGTVKGLRALTKGGWSVTIHLPDQPSVKPGDRVAIAKEKPPSAWAPSSSYAEGAVFRELEDGTLVAEEPQHGGR